MHMERIYVENMWMAIFVGRGSFAIAIQFFAVFYHRDLCSTRVKGRHT